MSRSPAGKASRSASRLNWSKSSLRLNVLNCTFIRPTPTRNALPGRSCTLAAGLRHRRLVGREGLTSRRKVASSTPHLMIRAAIRVR